MLMVAVVVSNQSVRAGGAHVGTREQQLYRYHRPTVPRGAPRFRQPETKSTFLRNRDCDNFTVGLIKYFHLTWLDDLSLFSPQHLEVFRA